MSKIQREQDRFLEIYLRRADLVYRVCFSFLKNPADTEDAVQNTFLRLLSSDPKFQDQEHEKAWLIVTASNLCRDQLRHWWKKREPLEWHEQTEAAPPTELDETLEALLSLPEKYRFPLYLFYYEGYRSGEIAQLLKKPPSTVRTYLQKGRELLRSKLGGDLFEG